MHVYSSYDIISLFQTVNLEYAYKVGSGNLIPLSDQVGSSPLLRAPSHISSIDPLPQPLTSCPVP